MIGSICDWGGMDVWFWPVYGVGVVVWVVWLVRDVCGLGSWGVGVVGGRVGRQD